MKKRERKVIVSVLIIFIMVFFICIYLISNVVSQSEEYHVFYVSNNGNDMWSGTLKDPNNQGDGPFLTLTAARNKIRSLKPLTKSVLIYIREGTYYLNEPFELTSQDSGTDSYSITYSAYPKEKVIISGGRKLELNWQRYNDKIYSANVGSLSFNSLFVDGNRAVRAKEPNNGYYFIDSVDTATKRDAFNFKPGDINPNWIYLNEIEVVSFRRWESSRFNIDRVEGNKVFFKNSLAEYRGYDWDYDFAFGLWPNKNTSRYYIENVFEGLDSPGEWYLDKHSGNLYYYPLDNKPIQNSEFISPKLYRLVALNGTSANYIKNVHINNMVFMHTDWYMSSNGIIYSPESLTYPDNAIDINFAENFRFENNTVSHTGGAGIGNYYYSKSKNIIINRNEISDIGSDGIEFSSIGKWLPLPPIEGLTISNNRVHDIGVIFKDKNNIMLLRTINSSISHNQIYNSNHGGIVFGNLALDFSYFKPNKIEYNDVHDVVQELTDGAGIYGNGNESGTIIEYNKVHDIKMTDKHSYNQAFAGIYLDEGSDGYIVRNNWIYNTDVGVLYNGAKNSIFRNNIIVNPVTRAVWFSYPQKYIVLNKNIFYSTINNPVLFRYNLDQKGNVSSNFNLFYKTGDNSNWNLNQWKTDTLNDSNSIEQNPLFVDESSNNYELQSSSPALSLGFENFNLNNAGPLSVECFDDSSCNNAKLCIQTQCICVNESSEICDSKDNNCNGLIDEGLSCTGGTNSDPGSSGGGNNNGDNTIIPITPPRTNQTNLPISTNNITNFSLVEMPNNNSIIPQEPKQRAAFYIILTILILSIVLIVINIIGSYLSKIRAKRESEY